MIHKLYVVDSFTSRPFAGNPAGVCVLKAETEPSWMQSVARELKHSETAFPRAEGDGYRLRWFTPTVEVRLCGHATLAAAHVLRSEGYHSAKEPLRFQTLSGVLTATTGIDGWIQLDFPADPVTTAQETASYEKAIGTAIRFAGKSRDHYLLELESEQTVRNLAPDFAAIATLGGYGVIVTARADTPPYDFVSRFFAPAIGIDEDPVTGAAHCVLGPYWSSRLGKKELFAYQASERGGEIRVTVRGERVLLGGQAVTVFRGELLA